MSGTFEVTLELEGLRGFVRLGSVRADEFLPNTVMHLLNTEAVRALLAANPGVSMKLRLRAAKEVRQ